MIEIKKVTDELMAIECDNLLTKLLQSDRRFDDNMKETYRVEHYYVNKIDNERNILFLAYDNQTPIGYVYGYIKYPSGDFVYDSVAQIDSLYVEDGYRNQGIATCLMNQFYAWCRDNKVKYVEIYVFKDNEDAYNLYRKQGFETEIYHMTKEL